MNITNIDVHPPTIKAAYNCKKDHIYQTAMLVSQTGSVLDIGSIKHKVVS